jgi:mannose-6-phosphate isomerase
LKLEDKRPVVRFPAPEDLGPRQWGDELLLVLAPGKYTMKRLFIKEGSHGGLQYHRIKDEAGFVISGRLRIRFEEGPGKLTERELGPGDFFHFPNGSVHQECALTDVVLLEVSTPHFNDRVRVEPIFGLESGHGLPTTEMEAIVSK